MQIGNIVFSNNVFLAPMAGVTDKAFRIICKELDCGFVYTEMVSSRGLHYNSQKTFNMLDIDDREAPAGVQLFGCSPEIMGETAAKICQNDKIILIDINMGCPAPKIVKNGEGSALMKNPKLASNIIRSVVHNSRVPVTVKFRKGWDDESINAVEFAKMAEESGASAVSVHGRTKMQMYEGRADLDIIKKVKKAVKIPVLGNGDIFDPVSAKKMLDETECDGILVARGAMGNPWIFENINIYLKTGILKNNITPSEQIDMAIKHLNMAVSFKGEKLAVKEMRKHIAWYLKGLKNSADIKNTINNIVDKNDIIKILLEYKYSLL